MASGRVILDKERFQLTILRLCHELIEAYGNFRNCCFIGIQDRGVAMADRIIETIKEINPEAHISYGKLDITFYRDDFRTRDTPLKASMVDMPFLVDEKNVILIDDVLYTGRTIHAAMTAVQSYGRAARIELVTMVDRRFNRHFPIKADYYGLRVDSVDEAYVRVEWKNVDGKDRIKLFSAKTKEH